MTSLHSHTAPNSVLVWIDSHEAHVISWDGQRCSARRLESDVPAHHRATGGVRHAGGVHPGGGPPVSALEGHREEHLRRFLENVRGLIPDHAAVTLRGPGVVAMRLARELRTADRRAGVERVVEIRRQGPMSGPQLVAAVRSFAGDARPRRHPARRRSRQHSASPPRDPAIDDEY